MSNGNNRATTIEKRQPNSRYTYTHTFVNVLVSSENKTKIRLKGKSLHWPRLELGSPAWQASILPLDHQCFSFFSIKTLFLACVCKNKQHLTFVSLFVLYSVCDPLHRGVTFLCVCYCQCCFSSLPK